MSANYPKFGPMEVVEFNSDQLKQESSSPLPSNSMLSTNNTNTNGVGVITANNTTNLGPLNQPTAAAPGATRRTNSISSSSSSNQKNSVGVGLPTKIFKKPRGRFAWCILNGYAKRFLSRSGEGEGEEKGEAGEEEGKEMVDAGEEGGKEMVKAREGREKGEGGVPKVRCRFGECQQDYLYSNRSLASICRHLKKAHNVTEYSPVNDVDDINQLQQTQTQEELSNNKKKIPTDTRVLPYAFVRDPQLLNFLKLPRPNRIQPTSLPSATNPLPPPHHHQQQQLHNYTTARAQQILQSQKSISLSLHRWRPLITNNNNSPPERIAVTAHLLHNRWDPRDALLGFLPPHPPAALAAQLMRLIDRFRIGHLVFTITTDASASMRCLVEALSKLPSALGGECGFDPAWQHVVGLDSVIDTVVLKLLALAGPLVLAKLRAGVTRLR